MRSHTPDDPVLFAICAVLGAMAIAALSASHVLDGLSWIGRRLGR